MLANNGGVDPNSLTADNFRPLQGFSDLNLATNNVYANYNALQMTWVRTQGPLHHQPELHVRQGDGYGHDEQYLDLDQFNLNNDYGVQPANRTHIFNIAYSVELGNFANNKIAGGFVNGWQLSGITQVESGANLTGFSRQLATSA